MVFSRFFWGLQLTPTLWKNIVDFDQSVLSRMLVLRNTAGRVCEGRSRLWKSDEKKIMI
jgi:hypothetical protein